MFQKEKHFLNFLESKGAKNSFFDNIKENNQDLLENLSIELEENDCFDYINYFITKDEKNKDYWDEIEIKWMEYLKDKPYLT